MTAAIQGPSLPPRVYGPRIGTLTIHLEECSAVDAFARIRFWGEKTFSDLHPHTNRPPPGDGIGRSAVVEYPLIGSVAGLRKYLTDASPLQVQFLRPLAPNDSNGADAQLQGHPKFVGCASIPDVDEQLQNAPHTFDFSLRRRLVIVRPDAGSANGSHTRVGEALFGLHFRVMSTAAATSCPQRYFMKQDVLGHPPLRQKDDSAGCLHDSRPHPHASSSSNPHLVDDSTELQSGFDTTGTEDQPNLLDELLDLCADDMTMPSTTASADLSCVDDPYDMWISRIVAHASSPPAKEFPSLASAGSCRSSDLRKVGTLKLEVDGLTLFASCANRINGPNDFYLAYHPPPHASEPGDEAKRLLSDPVEIKVCKNFGSRLQRAGARVQPRSLKTKYPRNPDEGITKEVALMSSVHSKQMQVEFKNDEAVRDWLDGTVEFRLSFCASTQADHPKLPRVARLASKKKDSTPATNPSRVELGRATLSLRDVILSHTFASYVKLDLTSSSKGDGLVGDAQQLGARIGSISVRLSLHFAGKDTGPSPCGSDENSSATMKPDRKTAQILMRGPQSASLATPHPISVFLSNYAEASPNNVGTVAASALPARVHASGSCAKAAATGGNEPLARHSDAKNEGKVDAPLKPVKAPPIWLDVRLDRISGLSMDTIPNESGSIQLSMSCSKPILSLDSLTHLQSEGSDKSISAGSQIRSEGTVKLNAGSNVPISRSVSIAWQAALDAQSDGHTNTAITVHVWHLNSDAPLDAKKTLLGLVELPLPFDPVSNSQRTLCDWLPTIAANGWFDIVHPNPNTKTVVGKARMTVAAGMLRQIRGFSAVCLRVSTVQRWWRRTRCCISNRKEEPQKEEPDNTSPKSKSRFSENEVDCLADRSPREFDPNFDTVHAGFIAQREVALERRNGDPASSPDSLFEEWSQQSLPVTRIEFNNRRQSEGKKPSKPAAATDASIDSSIVGESSEDVPIEAPVERNDECRERPSLEEVASECASENDDSCDSCDILVRLEKLSGLREMLSTWLLCQQGGLDMNEELVSVSGIFVSYSIGHKAESLSEKDELRKLCLCTNVWHSKVMPTEAINRDADHALNMESTVSMPNYETNTAKILSQVLLVRVWWIPIVTTTIAGMIDGGKAKDIKSLDGCTIIATAQCPLYPLYTPKGLYRGKVPCIVTACGHKGGIGSIVASVCRIDLSNTLLGSPPILSDVGSQSNAQHGCVMSHLKPTNLLETSFGRDGAQSTGIDPPEEREQSSSLAPSSSKRKLEQSHGVSFDACREPRQIKRYRAMKTPETMDQKGNPPDVDVSHSFDDHSHERSSYQEDHTEESETLCPSDGSLSQFDQGSESDAGADDALTYRSLTSVMGSLVNINSRLQRVGSIDDGKTKTSTLDSSHDTGQCQSRRTNDSPANFAWPKSDPDECIGHQMEPPEERTSPSTPTKQKSVEDVPHTREKGSSPMSLVRHCADASTSPCGESLAADDSAHDRQTTSEDNREPPTGVQEEDGDGTSKDDFGDGSNPIRSPSRPSKRSSSEMLKHRLEQSTRGRLNRARSQEPRFQYMPSRSHSSLALAPSSSRVFKGSPFFQRGLRLSSPLRSLSPPAREIVPPKGADAEDGNSVCPEKQTQFSSVDRLERVFRSES